MDEDRIRSNLKQFICAELLRQPDYPLHEDEPLITSGLMDSFSIAQIGVYVEKVFNVYIPDTEMTIERFDTLNQMTEQILSHARDQA
jgi:acyl carrier protein